MARRKKAAAEPLEASVEALADTHTRRYETKDYPPDQVAQQVAEPIAQIESKPLPPPPDFGHFTDPGQVPLAVPAAAVAGVVPAKAPVFQLTPYSMEPDTAPTPNLAATVAAQKALEAKAAPAPEPHLPSYLVSSDGTPIPEPATRRLTQLAWLAGAAALIGASLFFWLRPGTPPAPGSPAAYELAAKQGDVHAMRTLGTWYTYGLNVKRDPGRGLYWYRKAATAGDPVAQQELNSIEGTKQ